MRRGAQLVRAIKNRAISFKKPKTKAVGGLRGPRPAARSAPKIFKTKKFKL